MPAVPKGRCPNCEGSAVSATLIAALALTTEMAPGLFRIAIVRYYMPGDAHLSCDIPTQSIVKDGCRTNRIVE